MSLLRKWTVYLSLNLYVISLACMVVFYFLKIFYQFFLLLLTFSRGMRYENVSVLIEAIEELITKMLYCWVDKEGTICRQNGVFRINCIDCLDRTNVVQVCPSVYLGVFSMAQVSNYSKPSITDRGAFLRDSITFEMLVIGIAFSKETLRFSNKIF